MGISGNVSLIVINVFFLFRQLSHSLIRTIPTRNIMRICQDFIITNKQYVLEVVD